MRRCGPAPIALALLPQGDPAKWSSRDVARWLKASGLGSLTVPLRGVAGPALLECGRDPAAALPVFLDFISYSSGPLPEDLLAAVSVRRPGLPVSIIWGAADPWEKVEWGRALGDKGTYPCVESFTEVDAGHCPMDEAPDTVNPLVVDFVRRHAASSS